MQTTFVVCLALWRNSLPCTLIFIVFVLLYIYGKRKELCLPFMILLLHYNRWSSNISYKSISNKPNLLLVLEKNPVRSFVSESRRNNMNIYSLKNIIERYWDRIQNSQSRRWLINGCKWSSFLAIQYSNSTHLEPLIRDFVFKGLSFSQTILCYSKKKCHSL